MSNTNRDFYEILSVSKDADEKQLKSAYRKLAMKYHPDRNPNDAKAEKLFKECNEAYSILKDPEKRAAYDRYGHAAFEGGMGGGGNNPNGGGFSDIFDDIFNGFMGGGGRQQQNNRGSDLRYNMEITLEEAFRGVVKEFTINKSEKCSSCNGSGAFSDKDLKKCTACNGHGKTRTSQGFFTIEQTCSKCQGQGMFISKHCKTCNGLGKSPFKKNISINVPAGIDDDTRIRKNGDGDAGHHGAGNGDLYVFINVKPHHIFHRDGIHIFCQVPIPMTVLALGGNVEVPTIDGQLISLEIPDGTPSGKKFRIRGKGMNQMRSSARGDMYVEAIVEIPVSLSKRQKELLNEFNEDPSYHNPHSEGFFSKVKDFFDNLGP